MTCGIGYGNKRVAQAAAAQMSRLQLCWSWFWMNEREGELAEHVLKHVPSNLTRVQFLNSGSEATDSSIKLAYQYFLERGKAEVRRASTRVELTKTELARYEKLIGSSTVSQEAYDVRRQNARDAEAQLASARATLRSGELDLEFTQIKSPIRGRISNKRVDVGNVVSGGSPESLLRDVLAALAGEETRGPGHHPLGPRLSAKRALASCTAAIKAHQQVSAQELQALLTGLAACRRDGTEQPHRTCVAYPNVNPRILGGEHDNVLTGGHPRLARGGSHLRGHFYHGAWQSPRLAANRLGQLCGGATTDVLKARQEGFAEHLALVQGGHPDDQPAVFIRLGNGWRGLAGE